MDLPKGLKCIIFDMDGTLAEFPIDYDAMRKDLKEKASEFGIKSDFRPLIPSIREVAARSGNPRLLSELFAIVDRYEIESVKSCSIIAPAMRLYEKSFELGLKVAVLTRNGRRMVDTFLKGHRIKNPTVICSREDSALLKPHPDHLKPIESRFGFRKSEYLLIGDSEHDEQLAKNTGIRFVNSRILDG